MKFCIIIRIHRAHLDDQYIRIHRAHLDDQCRINCLFRLLSRLVPLSSQACVSGLGCAACAGHVILKDEIATCRQALVVSAMSVSGYSALCVRVEVAQPECKPCKRHHASL